MVINLFINFYYVLLLLLLSFEQKNNKIKIFLIQNILIQNIFCNYFDYNILLNLHLIMYQNINYHLVNILHILYFVYLIIFFFLFNLIFNSNHMPIINFLLNICLKIIYILNLILINHFTFTILYVYL